MSSENFVEMVKALSLQPGDIVAVMRKRRITKEQADVLVKQVQEAVPGHRVLVFPPELDVEVRKEENEGWPEPAPLPADYWETAE